MFIFPGHLSRPSVLAGGGVLLRPAQVRGGKACVIRCMLTRLYGRLHLCCLMYICFWYRYVYTWVLPVCGDIRSYSLHVYTYMHAYIYMSSYVYMCKGIQALDWDASVFIKIPVFL